MWAPEAYAQTCFHLGFQLEQGILDALTQHGLLMLDLRLCSPASLSTTCSTLREKPTGIRQIVFRDGLRCFKDDMAYRKHAVAKDRQFGKYAFNPAHLRMLMTALSVFLTARGQRICILDLEGVPLSKQLSSLLAPLAATLSQTGARHMQWLNLSGCGISDRGLALLLPALGHTGQVRLPQLEALLLAENKLSDVQLVIHLLRSRTWLSVNGKAASLRLLDLSQNSRLVTERSVPARSSGKSRPGAGLILSVSRFLADGLPLQVLRLKSMKLQNEDILPLVKLLGAEADSLAMGDNKGFAFGTSLEDLDLTGNFCSAQLQAEVADSIFLLKQLRSQPEICWRLRQQPPSYKAMQRDFQWFQPQSCSKPVSETSETSAAGIERDAVSEGQADVDLPGPPTPEEFQEAARYFERNRRVVKYSCEDMKEIVVGSPEPPPLLIKQMILAEFHAVDPLEGLATAPEASQPQGLSQLLPPSQREREMGGVQHLVEDVGDGDNADEDVEEMDPHFEGVSSRCKADKHEGPESCSDSQMPLSSMAEGQWKDEFFNGKINELCQSFLEPRCAESPVAVELPQRSVLLGVTQPRDSQRLDAVHREALQSLQSRLLGVE